MVILYFLPPFLLLAASFALGHLPVRLLARWLSKGVALPDADALPALAGAMGTALGFLFAGMTGYDRFALAPERVRDAWMNSGQAFLFELAQPVFSGALCAGVVLCGGRISPNWHARLGMVSPLAALLISFVDFLLWPVLFGPFVP